MRLSSSKSSPPRHPPADAEGTRGIRTTMSTAVVVLVLSLTAWVCFYFANVPLNAAETTVVVGLITLMVILVKWVWTRMRASVKGRRASSALPLPPHRE